MKKFFQFSFGQMILLFASLVVFAFVDFYLGAKLGPHFFWGIDLGEVRGGRFLPEQLSEEQLAALLAEEGEVAITFHQELEGNAMAVTELPPPAPPSLSLPAEKSKTKEVSARTDPISDKPVSKAALKPSPDVGAGLKPAPTSQPDSPVRYTLKVGSFSSYKEAQTLAKKFQGRGFPARIETVQIPDKGNWHRVHVGPFPTQAEALSQRSAIERSFGIMPVIVSL